jgi:hypothetical protein
VTTFDLDTPVRPQDTARQRFDIHRRRIHAVATVLTRDRVVTATDEEIGQLVGMKRWNVTTTRRLMIAIGALEILRIPGQKMAGWKLLLDDAELFHAIDLEMERQMRGGMSPESQRTHNTKSRKLRKLTPKSQEQAAVTEDRLGFAVAAVVGPEPINALRTSLKGSGPDAPGALVLAAKQYARDGGRSAEQRKAAQLVKELNEIGVSVPPDLAAKAAVRHDARLEAIGLVLPYVEALEQRLRAMELQLRDQADYGSLRQKVESQHRQIERLVAGRTAEAMRADPNGPTARS